MFNGLIKKIATLFDLSRRVSYIEDLYAALYVISPNFAVVKTKENDELIMFDYMKDFDTVIFPNELFSSKTQFEALSNHVHLFDNVRKKDQEAVRKISIAIAKNLKKSLATQFPTKKFIVYLELNYKDSIIVRFHQIWEDEDLYFDPKYQKKEYDMGRIIVI